MIAYFRRADRANQSSKNQAPTTRKVSKHKLQGGDVASRIRIWSLELHWCLELGFWRFHPGVWILEFGTCPELGVWDLVFRPVGFPRLTAATLGSPISFRLRGLPEPSAIDAEALSGQK